MQITELSGIPTMGALLGSRGDAQLVNHINKMTGSNYFGSQNDRYAAQYNNFLSTYIEPIRRANNEIRIAVERLQKPDTIRRVDTYEGLREIPPAMMIPTVTYGPLFTLLRQGRVDGWGFNPEWLEDEKETYDRLIETNGVIDFSEEPDGEEPDTYLHHFEIDMADPEISHEDRIFIMQTREFIQKILDDTDLDPTDLDNIRG